MFPHSGELGDRREPFAKWLLGRGAGGEQQSLGRETGWVAAISLPVAHMFREGNI